MSASSFLGRLVAAFEKADVGYMLTGSLASSWHGSPRTTQDIDIVVELDAAGLERLLPLLTDDRYYPRCPALLVAGEALTERLATHPPMGQGRAER